MLKLLWKVVLQIMLLAIKQNVWIPHMSPKRILISVAARQIYVIWNINGFQPLLAQLPLMVCLFIHNLVNILIVEFLYSDTKRWFIRCEIHILSNRIHNYNYYNYNCPLFDLQTSFTSNVQWNSNREYQI